MKPASISDGVYRNGFFCSICETLKPASNQMRWHCDDCSEDVCYSCHPGPQFGKKASTPPTPKVIVIQQQAAPVVPPPPPSKKKSKESSSNSMTYQQLPVSITYYSLIKIDVVL